MKTRPSRQQAVSRTHGPMKQPVSAPLRVATHPTTLIQRAGASLGALTPTDVLQLQRTIGNRAVGQLLARATQRQSMQKAQSTTMGLADPLKSGIESLSGISMEGVKVHYNSPQPAQLNALAYAQGGDIHVGPGQERHLPHEAWHFVQKAQGRVKPTMQTKGGVPVNDDPGLEQEADVMGTKARQMRGPYDTPPAFAARPLSPPAMAFAGRQGTVQRVVNPFDFDGLLYSSKENPNQPIPGSIYFENGRIRLVHDREGPEIDEVPGGSTRYRVSASAEQMDEYWQARREGASKATRVERMEQLGNLQPTEVGAEGTLFEYETKDGEVVMTHPSRGQAQPETGVRGQAHLDRLAAIAYTAQREIAAARTKKDKESIVAYWNNQIEAAYLNPPRGFTGAIGAVTVGTGIAAMVGLGDLERMHRALRYERGGP